MKIISIELIMDAVKDQRKSIFESEEKNSPEKNFEVENLDESEQEGMERPHEDPSYEDKKT